jgi:hypothetical protein
MWKREKKTTEHKMYHKSLRTQQKTPHVFSRLCENLQDIFGIISNSSLVILEQWRILPIGNRDSQ